MSRRVVLYRSDKALCRTYVMFRCCNRYRILPYSVTTTHPWLLSPVLLINKLARCTTNVEKQVSYRNVSIASVSLLLYIYIYIHNLYVIVRLWLTLNVVTASNPLMAYPTRYHFNLTTVIMVILHVFFAFQIFERCGRMANSDQLTLARQKSRRWVFYKFIYYIIQLSIKQIHHIHIYCGYIVHMYWRI